MTATHPVSTLTGQQTLGLTCSPPLPCHHGNEFAASLAARRRKRSRRKRRSSKVRMRNDHRRLASRNPRSPRLATVLTCIFCLSMLVSCSRMTKSSFTSLLNIKSILCNCTCVSQRPKARPSMNREVSNEFRPSTWITDVIPRKSPFVPQMGDEVRDCLDHMASLLLCASLGSKSGGWWEEL